MIPTTREYGLLVEENGVKTCVVLDCIAPKRANGQSRKSPEISIPTSRSTSSDLPDGVVIYKDTDVYSPIYNQCAIVPDGRVYILTDESNMLYRYNAAGEKVGVFGGKGQGPGELLSPIYLGYHDGKIWISDSMTKYVSFYDLEGHFIERHKQLDLGTEIFKTETGFYFPVYRYGKNTPAELYAVDHQLKNKRLVMRWTPRWMSPGKPRKPVAVHQKSLAVNPAKEFLHFGITHDLRFFYLAHVGPRFKIDIIDTTTHRIIHTITRPWEPFAFDEAWGRAEIEKADSEGRFSLDAPEYFPHIRGFMPLPGHRLMITRWSAYPDHKKYAFVFDHQGRRVQPEESHYNRIIAIHGETAYLTGYNEESGQGMLIRCHKADIDRVAAFYDDVYIPPPQIHIALDNN
ncbi:MAG: 6-bladed beta-propeller [Acidobacteriota bacterium]|nr:6-bladed beta-propeller [Acidobacteriota bacterium]